MLAEQAAIEAKIEAVNRAEVEREAAEKEKMRKEEEEEMAMEMEMKMVMEAEKMVAEEVAKEVFIEMESQKSHLRGSVKIAHPVAFASKSGREAQQRRRINRPSKMRFLRFCLQEEQRSHPRSLVKTALHIAMFYIFRRAAEPFEGDSQNSEDAFSGLLVTSHCNEIEPCDFVFFCTTFLPLESKV